MNLEILINAILALFAILNPIGNIPIFAEFTDGLDRKTRMSVFNVAVLTGYGTLLIMSMTGQWIMNNVFQIDILEFRIAGGILLTVLAVKYIVFPEKKDVPSLSAKEHKVIELGVVPMAVPLLVGPGSIVTGILLLNRDGYLITFCAITIIFAICWILFQLSPWISRSMGKIGRLVISRIMWIFIAAIGVHFLISGIQETFHI